MSPAGPLLAGADRRRGSAARFGGAAQPTDGDACTCLDILPLFFRDAMDVNKRSLKVKELAMEVGVTARELVARCRAEGMAVQNSISRLTVQEERIVRHWFEGGRDKESQ
jgi:hypothetical protein